MTDGVNPRRLPMPWLTGSGSLMTSMARARFGQAADEAALLQRRDQPVNAGFGAQIERVLHLVEGRRNAGFLEPLMDETQKLELFPRQHRGPSLVG